MSTTAAATAAGVKPAGAPLAALGPEALAGSPEHASGLPDVEGLAALVPFVRLFGLLQGGAAGVAPVALRFRALAALPWPAGVAAPGVGPCKHRVMTLQIKRQIFTCQGQFRQSGYVPLIVKGQ